MTRRALVPLSAGIVTAALLAACGSGSSGGGSTAPAASSSAGSLAGATFTVSSKDFTESILLAKITEDVLQANGAKINDKTNIKGSVNTRTALTSGDVDMYWEYTGTAWISYLKQTKPIADPAAQFDAVKKADVANGIAWLDAAPMNDTYAMAVRSNADPKLVVPSLTQLATLATSDPTAATFCIESEFSTRDDGFPGMTKAYGITVPKANVKLLDTGVIYKETAAGKTCNYGEVFATDGRIAALKLKVLDDDQHFFPNYNAALTLKQSLLTKYPQIATLMKPIAAKLDNATMTSLNAQVDADGDDPADVAKKWLTDQGLLK